MPIYSFPVPQRIAAGEHRYYPPTNLRILPPPTLPAPGSAICLRYGRGVAVGSVRRVYRAYDRRWRVVVSVRGFAHTLELDVLRRVQVLAEVA
jgi:hypothetical protein